MATRALANAIGRNDMQAATSAITNGANVSVILWQAVIGGHPRVVRFLHDAGGWPVTNVFDSFQLDDIRDWASSSVVEDNVREASRAVLSYLYQEARATPPPAPALFTGTELNPNYEALIRAQMSRLGPPSGVQQPWAEQNGSSVTMGMASPNQMTPFILTPGGSHDPSLASSLEEAPIPPRPSVIPTRAASPTLSEAADADIIPVTNTFYNIIALPQW